MKTLIITRHTALVQFLNQKGIVGEVLAQASPDDIRGKDVYGILPLHFAALANSITTVTLNLPLEMCGKSYLCLMSKNIATLFVKKRTT